jgi:hypothetical protein
MLLRYLRFFPVVACSSEFVLGLCIVVFMLLDKVCLCGLNSFHGIYVASASGDGHTIVAQYWPYL